MTSLDTRDLATPLTPVAATDPALSWKVQCLNCQSALTGPFCAECGQRAVPPHPSVKELMGDAVSEFVGWDGKFAETIRTLIRIPGGLTRQWLDGRRAHFISPLRLYLTASFVFFVIEAGAPARIPPNITTPNGAEVSLHAKPSPQVAAEAARQAVLTGKPLSQSEKDSASVAIAKAPWGLKPMLTRLIDDPAGFRDNLKRLSSRVLFALIPFYAGILGLFYWRRKYPEHLYFAIHLHSFIFLALSLSQLAKYTHLPVLPSLVSFATVLWIVSYSILALRRVYGGSLGLNFLKGVGIMALYSTIGLVALIVMIALAALL